MSLPIYDSPFSARSVFNRDYNKTSFSGDYEIVHDASTFTHWVLITKDEKEAYRVLEHEFIPAQTMASIILIDELAWQETDPEEVYRGALKYFVDAKYVKKYVGISIGPRYYYQPSRYSNFEIDRELERHLQLVLKGQPDAQSIYFDTMRSKLKFLDPMRNSETEFEFLLALFKESVVIGLKEGFGKWVSDLLHYFAEYIRQAIRDDPNEWRPVTLTGEDNPNYKPFFPGESVEFVHEKLSLGLDVLQKHVTKSVSNFMAKKRHLSDNDFIYSRYIALTIEKVITAFSKVIAVFKDILDFFKEALYHLNAFFIGVYNGIVEAIAGIFDMFSFLFGLFDDKKAEAFFKQLESVYTKVQEEGVWALIKEIIDTFIKKYTEAPTGYDVAVVLGKDIVLVIIDVLLSLATFGGGAVKRLQNLLKQLTNMDGFYKAKFAEFKDIYRAYLMESRGSLNENVPVAHGFSGAQQKLFLELSEFFYRSFAELLERLLDNALVIGRWTVLRPMKALKKTDIDELLAMRKLNKKAYNKNAAIMHVELEVNGKIEVLEYRALAGNSISGEGAFI